MSDKPEGSAKAHNPTVQTRSNVKDEAIPVASIEKENS